MSDLADLTEHQAREAPAGPETDALVAEATGWEVKQFGGVGLLARKNADWPWNDCKPYSTDRNAAGGATDWLIPLTSGRIIIEHDNNEPAEYLWAVSYRPGGARTSVHAPAEPLARCRAVLLAAVIRREQKK